MQPSGISLLRLTDLAAPFDLNPVPAPPLRSLIWTGQTNKVLSCVGETNRQLSWSGRSY